jgi:heptosyltransferase II
LTAPRVADGSRLQILASDAPCSPCFLRECPIDFRCMNGIGVEVVVAGVLKSAGMQQ